MLETIIAIYISAVRVILPALCVLLVFLCCKRLFKIGKRSVLGRLTLAESQTVYEITTDECSLGRSKINDIRLNIASVSRRHAVLTYCGDCFRISSVNGTEILVNGIALDGFAYIQSGDKLEIGGCQLALQLPEYEDISSSTTPKKHSSGVGSTAAAALVLTLIQMIICSELIFHYIDNIPMQLPAVFGLMIAAEWIYFLVCRLRGNMQIEIMGLFLTTLGFAVAASAYPSSLFKEAIAFFAGFAVFIAFRFIFRNIELTMKMRYIMAGGAILLLLYNLIFGININGARNWISLGFTTLQPSELIKFAFIFAGASTLQRLMAKRNLILFLAFGGGCIGALFLMRDFGTALIYFATMLIIMFMRSGDVKIITAVTATAAVGGGLIARFVPYVNRRFSTFRRAWELAADKGYQQTRTMIAIASGGLLGVGGGAGNLDLVAAADTDLVFGMLCEEWGMIVAFCAISCFVFFAIYSLRCTPRTKSSFFAIAASAAAGLYIIQISLNIFGSVDLLPLTGVTMPFVSNGGSSMLASWALLSYIKAVGEQLSGR